MAAASVVYLRRLDSARRTARDSSTAARCSHAVTARELATPAAFRASWRNTVCIISSARGRDPVMRNAVSSTSPVCRRANTAKEASLRSAAKRRSNSVSSMESGSVIVADTLPAEAFRDEKSQLFGRNRTRGFHTAAESPSGLIPPRLQHFSDGGLRRLRGRMLCRIIRGLLPPGVSFAFCCFPLMDPFKMTPAFLGLAAR